jgi:hypothetical protein
MERDRIVREEKQFKEMERDRITREERQEMIRQEREAKAEEKRGEREARMEEKRLDAQREMFSFLQKMMKMNTNKNTNQEQEASEEMNTSGSSAKRTSAQLSNSNEETVMKDTETVPDVQDNEEDVLLKTNKTRTGEADDTEEDDIMYDDRTLEK